MADNLYVVLITVEGTTGQKSYVYSTKRAALLKIADHMDDEELKQLIEETDDEELDDLEIDWGNDVDLQVQTLDSDDDPETDW